MCSKKRQKSGGRNRPPAIPFCSTLNLNRLTPVLVRSVMRNQSPAQPSRALLPDDPRYDSRVSLGARAQVDALCQQLEDSWRSGNPARIEDYLIGCEGLKRELALRELLAVEIEYRQRRGELPCRSGYLAHFPQDEKIIALVLAEALADGPFPSPG